MTKFIWKTQSSHGLPLKIFKSKDQVQSQDSVFVLFVVSMKGLNLRSLVVKSKVPTPSLVVKWKVPVFTGR